MPYRRYFGFSWEFRGEESQKILNIIFVHNK
jgi:hypothetical protein